MKVGDIVECKSEGESWAGSNHAQSTYMGIILSVRRRAGQIGVHVYKILTEEGAVLTHLPHSVREVEA